MGHRVRSSSPAEELKASRKSVASKGKKSATLIPIEYSTRLAEMHIKSLIPLAED